MAIGLIGRKCGMSRFFTEDGRSLPVTVVEVCRNQVVRCLSDQAQGYQAIQIAWGKQKSGRHANRAIAGIYAKAKIAEAEGLVEFRVDGEAMPAEGSEIKADIFSEGEKVDVSGVTIGKGYSGTIKRHGFSHQRNSHGNSVSHRAPGSIGQCQTPGRVFKGKKMAGHMGHVKKTAQNLEIIQVDSERNLLLIKGSVPSAKGGKIIIKPAVKACA